MDQADQTIKGDLRLVSMKKPPKRMRGVTRVINESEPFVMTLPSPVLSANSVSHYSSSCEAVLFPRSFPPLAAIAIYNFCKVSIHKLSRNSF